MSNISLDKDTFFRRMKKLYAAWKVGLDVHHRCSIILCTWILSMILFSGCCWFQKRGCVGQGRLSGVMRRWGWRYNLQQIDGVTGLFLLAHRWLHIIQCAQKHVTGLDSVGWIVKYIFRKLDSKISIWGYLFIST